MDFSKHFDRVNERIPLNVVFACYREWAHDVSTFVADHSLVDRFCLVEDPEELTNVMTSPPFEVDLVMLCGWSWPPPEWMVNSGVMIVSEHPAASDRYSPGTPLQNQILDGLTTTKHRIVKVGFPELAPRLYSHEIDMSLEGNMDEILERMRSTSIKLFNAFLQDYPHVFWKQWPAVDPVEQAPRRADASLGDLGKHDQLVSPKLTTRELYDKIRCLGVPYPNAYMEDETGRLYFEKVRFESR